MSFSLSNYVHHTPEEMFQAAARAARSVSQNEWELGAWLLAIERTRAYESAGFRNAVGYAAVRLGIEAQKASNLLRIMGTLEGLPRLSKAFLAGEIGYAKIREVTRVATPETESAWLEFARGHTTDQVRQRVVCSPAAYDRRVRSIQSQADSLFSRRGEAVKRGPGLAATGTAACGAGGIGDESGAAGDGGRGRVEAFDADGLQGGTLGRPPADGDKAAPGLKAGTLARTAVDGDKVAPGSQAGTLARTAAHGDGALGFESSAGSSAREQAFFSLEEDGLPAPQRVRLVVELSAEEYAEWGATVERVSRQLGHRASSREVILELARRHVASTSGNSLQRNPVVVRLETDGSGFVQTDRGPLAVSRQSSEEYLARASSVVVQGAQASVLLLGGRRRKRLPAEVLRGLVARSEGCCECCSQRGLLHVHHIRPLSRGGTNALENLRLLCSACHSREHVEDFKPGSPWERARERRRRNRNSGGHKARRGALAPQARVASGFPVQTLQDSTGNLPGVTRMPDG